MGIQQDGGFLGLVKRRHTYVGAPDNRIEALFKEIVLTPRGRDMNPELGPVVAASPEKRLSYLSGCDNGNYRWVSTQYCGNV